MQDILIILACISLGMGLGYARRADSALLALADKAALYAVYALLFVLGLRLGFDAALLEKLPLLGSRALGIALLCSAGSIAAVSLIAGSFSLASPRQGARAEGTGYAQSLWASARILGAFSLGILLAFFACAPGWMADSALASYALYLLVFAVGMGLGANLKAFRIVRDVHIKILGVPALIIAGSGLGAAAASLLLPGLDLPDALCVAAGFGYYSLSSILIENAGHSALASTALLSNILREVTAILAAPLLARYCGTLSTVAAAGATAMDTNLPIIARFSGERAAVIAVFSGMVLTLLVPFLVALLLQFLP